jgi:methylmalonyl-CoA mutase cobalamin-binding subunit
MARRKTRVLAALLLALLLATLSHYALARPVLDEEEREERPLRQIAPVPITPAPAPPAPTPPPTPPSSPVSPRVPSPTPGPRRPLPFEDFSEWLQKQVRELLKPLLPPEPQPPPPPVSPVRPVELVPGVKSIVRVLADSEEFVREALSRSGFRVGLGETVKLPAREEVKDSVEGFKEKLKKDGNLWNELSRLFGGEDKLERFLDSLKGGFERRYDAIVIERSGERFYGELKAAQDLAVNLRHAVEEAIKDAVMQDVKGIPVKWYINSGMKLYLPSSLQGSFSRARELIGKLLTKLGISYYDVPSTTVAQMIAERLKQVGLDKFIGKAAGAVIVVTVRDLTLELHVKEASPMPRAYCVNFGEQIACFDERGNPVEPTKVIVR